jgi:hypothetical protein
LYSISFLRIPSVSFALHQLPSIIIAFHSQEHPIHRTPSLFIPFSHITIPVKAVFIPEFTEQFPVVPYHLPSFPESAYVGLAPHSSYHVGPPVLCPVYSPRAHSRLYLSSPSRSSPDSAYFLFRYLLVHSTWSPDCWYISVLSYPLLCTFKA